jgi:transposase, IS5 family
VAKRDSVAASEGMMRPNQRETSGSNDLFRARLERIITINHQLVVFAGKIERLPLDGETAPD